MRSTARPVSRRHEVVVRESKSIFMQECPEVPSRNTRNKAFLFVDSDVIGKLSILLLLYLGLLMNSRPPPAL